MPEYFFRRFIYCTATLLSVFIISCSPNKPPHTGDNLSTAKKPDNVSEQEDFDLFFKKFQADSSFQLSRVSFPLKEEIKGEDGDSTKFVNQKDWVYTSIISGKIEKGIIRKKKISASEYQVQCQVNDTGY